MTLAATRATRASSTSVSLNDPALIALRDPWEAVHPPPPRAYSSSRAIRSTTAPAPTKSRKHGRDILITEPGGLEPVIIPTRTRGQTREPRSRSEAL